MTKKRKLTYDLDAIKNESFSPSALVATTSAIQGAAKLGVGPQEIVAVIQRLGRRGFYKSMTSNAHHRVWQDVHHARSDLGVIYVEFTAGAVTQFLLLSLKER